MANTALAAIHHLLNRRRILTGSWRLFAAWDRHEQAFQCLQIPKAILIGLAGFFSSIDREDECLAIFIAYAIVLETGRSFVDAFSRFLH